MSKPYKKKFGDMVLLARIQLNLGQTELAEAFDVSQSKVSKLECDKLEPSASELIWLADRILNINLFMALEAALEPARLEMVRRAVLRAHTNKEHREAPVEGCAACEAKIRRTAR